MTDHLSYWDALAKPAFINCRSCPWARSCLPRGLTDFEVERLDSVIKRNRPLQKDEFLVRAGEPVRNVFVLRSGACKSYLLSRSGDIQITGFHLPGELIGLDALGNRRHPSYSVTLQTSMVCAIPIRQLEQMASDTPKLRRRLLAIMSQKLLEEHEHQSFTREVAEQRLISFLLQLSARYAKRGLSASHFMLPMSRKDIANYLGLTSETVSRLFTRFREQGLIAGRGHEVRLLDMERMAQQVSLCVETKFLDDSNEARLARHEPAVCHPNLLDTRKKATS